MTKPLSSIHPNYSNLKGYWKFDEGTETFTDDVSGNGNTDTLVNNPQWIVSTVPLNRVAYYPFNGNANDESGNGNNGTVDGASLTTDRLGNLK